MGVGSANSTHATGPSSWPNTEVYAGRLDKNSPTSSARFSFWDRQGYLVSGNQPALTTVESVENTLTPTGWRNAHQRFCAAETCTDSSCHYVNEVLHSVASDGKKSLLVSQQRYPFNADNSNFLFKKGSNTADENGLLRITI